MEELRGAIDPTAWETIRSVLVSARDLFWAFRWFTVPVLGVLLFLGIVRYTGIRIKRHREDVHQKKIMKEAIREVREELLQEGDRSR